MTPYYLLDALKKEIDARLANYQGGPVTTYKFALPVRSEGGSITAPYIIIAPVQGVDDTTGATLKVRLYVVVRDEDPEQGWASLTELMENLRQYLLTSVDIGGRYYVTRPLKWDYPEGQAYPEWLGYIELEAAIDSPEIEGATLWQ